MVCMPACLLSVFERSVAHMCRQMACCRKLGPRIHHVALPRAGSGPACPHKSAQSPIRLVQAPPACMQSGLATAPTVRAGPGPYGMNNPQAPRLKCHKCGNDDANLVVSGGAMAGASVCGLCVGLEGLQAVANNVAFEGPARDWLTQALCDTVSNLEITADFYLWQLPPPPEQYGLGLGCSGWRGSTYVNIDTTTILTPQRLQLPSKVFCRQPDRSRPDLLRALRQCIFVVGGVALGRTTRPKQRT
jgi:hypothetical protein